MRIGEWKDGSYLGELITYTEERIYGIDISRYQHENVMKVKKWVRNRKGKKVLRVRNKLQRFSINWNDLKITHLGNLSKKTISGDVNYKISFIYIKSTEGKSIKNNYYLADYRAAHAHGYKVGTYHFFSTKTPGVDQAMFFLKNSRYQHGDFPPVLDVEPTTGQIRQMGGTKVMFAHIRKWLNMVEQAYGVKPILYVSQKFVDKHLPAAPDLMKKYNVWIARYGMYRPNVNLVYWQLCPDGRVKGINTEVDINVFNGFQTEWERFCGN
jgi:lysozyme